MKRRHHTITRALIAGAMLVCLGLASTYLLIRVATHTMNQFTDRLVAKAAEQKQAQSIEAERKQQTQLAIQSQQRWEAAQKRQQAEFERERRTAFDTLYVAPDGCEHPSSTRALTECANHKMRARQVFFDTYTPAEMKSALDATDQASSPMIKVGG